MIRGRPRSLSGILALLLTLAIVAPARAVTLDDIRKRGFVTCGVSEGIPGFSLKAEDGTWSGFDVDFCRALAAAVLGDATKVSFLPTTPEDRFPVLGKGRVDVLTRNTSWTMQRELEEGVLFPGVLFFDGQSFMVPKDLGLTSPAQLAGGKICVLAGTTSEASG